MGEAPQQLVAAIMVDNGLADQRAQAGHPIRKPLRNATTMQRKVGRPGFIGHQSNCLDGGPQPLRTALEFTYCLLRYGTGSVSCRAPAKAHPCETALRVRVFQARILRSDVAVGSRRSSS